VGFGALNMDKIALVDKIPSAEEEGFVLSVEWHPGGSAANTIVGLSRLGMRTGYVGKVGRDPEGSAMLRDLAAEGVETSGIVVCEGRTGAGLSLVDRQGQRALLIDPGVNDCISLQDVDLAYLASFDLLHMTSFVCKSTDLSLRTQLAIAQEIEIPLSLDPGQLYAERGLAALKPIIEKCAVVLPNQRELRLMTGLAPAEGARKLLRMGARAVAVKMGLKGCYITDGTIKERVPAYGGRGVDTTGAGDAFNAGFIYGLMTGMSLADCGRIGAKVAWFCVQKLGARAGLPTRKQLEELADGC